MLEQIDGGEPVTPFLRFGDRVRIEMLDAAGRSIFGAIDQRVVARRRALSCSRQPAVATQSAAA